MKHSMPNIHYLKFAVVIAIVAVAYFALFRTGTINFLQDSAAVKQWIQHLGFAGPIAIISLMAMAIVMSPVPSAPIALAAGAAYGHTEGTVYVVAGAELGAIIAFYIARLLGFQLVQHWVDQRITQRMLNSQNTLMGIVFVSRLLPFVSFDMVSYAAGVTPLKFWRFALATLAGILPASFLLAHFGSELASGEALRIGLTLLLLAGASLAFLLFNWLRSRKRR